MGELFSFTVNGAVQSTGEDKPLLRYLRDDLHLHSVKDGCSEGACGTCTVIVDGRAVKSSTGRPTAEASASRCSKPR